MNRLGRARHPRLRYAEGARSANRLDQTDVCATCGAVTWFGQMHACRPRAALTPDMKTALAPTTPGPLSRPVP